MADEVVTLVEDTGTTVEAAVRKGAWPHKYFPPIPQSILISTPTYLLPDSYDCRPEFSARLGGGGGGVVTIAPSRTSASAFIPVSSTRLTTSSAAEYRAVSVVLSL